MLKAVGLKEMTFSREDPHVTAGDILLDGKGRFQESFIIFTVSCETRIGVAAMPPIVPSDLF